MDTQHSIVAFTLAAGLLTVTPGLDTALVVRTAAVEGTHRGMQVALRICLGCFAWGASASLGLGVLLAASRLAYQGLRLAGALYLLWLGGKMVWHAIAPAGSNLNSVQVGQPSRQSWLARGFLTNILNPKVGVFYVSFLPLFVPTNARVIAFSMLLTCIHVAEGLIWFWLLTTIMRPLGAWVLNCRVSRTLDMITGSIVVAFGVRMLSERR